MQCRHSPTPAAWVRRLAAGLYVRQQLHASLPVDGTLTLAGLSAAVTVERDQLGVPTITAETRANAARALGFLHAQDRFFRMDLQRRQEAGELSELPWWQTADGGLSPFTRGQALSSDVSGTVPADGSIWRSGDLMIW